jgi:L-seryl-tRNA(Ser) seleniumtransferase
MALAAEDPAIMVRDDEIELGYFFLDPCNLHPGEAEIVGDCLVRVLNRPDRVNIRSTDQKSVREKLLTWPD